MVLIHQPERRHHCGPNRYGYWADYLYDPIGTVRQCGGCGRTWVAEESTNPGVLFRLWRREGRLTRWWRERKAQR